LQVFISFASEQKESAELIAVALRERGYKVFFSKDTLPAAQSYDVRIEKAVKSSDLFVFLVSPESVTKGKYTLTELSFARDQWSNPSGHILPVMIAATEIGKIPVYLRAVSIFEPEGNVAADTAAQVDKILKQTPRRDVALVAAGGAATGVLSYLVVLYWPNALRIPFVIMIGKYNDTGVTAVPGLLFGALVAFANWKSGIRDKLHLCVIVAFTLAAWVLAVNVTQFTFDQLSDYTKPAPAASNQDDAAATNQAGSAAPDAPAANTGGNGTPDASAVALPPTTKSLPFAPGLVGMIGGLIGGVGTLLGIVIVNVSMRRIEALLPAATVAVLLGAILQVAFIPGVFGQAGYCLLFVCWQSMVAAAIARALSSATAESA
jgi:hypothetical protein